MASKTLQTSAGSAADPASGVTPAPLYLLVAMMSASQMAITLHLAAVPALPELLGTTQEMVQFTVSGYLLAFALAQLFVGPLSDALGRRPLAIAGLVLFTLGSLAATYAPTIGWLLAARVVQALGACSGIVLSRAIVRDLYTGKRHTIAQAYLAIAMAIMPMVAPFLGGMLFEFFGWRSIFLVSTLTGIAVGSAVVFRLGETLPRKARRALRLSSFLRDYLRLSGMRRYLVYSLDVSFLNAGFNGFLYAAPLVFITVMGVPESLFGLFTMSAPASFMLGNLLASRFVNHYETDQVILAGNIIVLISGLAMLALMFTGLANSYTILVPIGLTFFGNGLVLPNCIAESMEAVGPSMAGAAAAYSGFLQMALSGLVVVILGAVTFTSVMPLAVTITVMGSLALLTFAFLPRRRATLAE